MQKEVDSRELCAVEYVPYPMKTTKRLFVRDVAARLKVSRAWVHMLAAKHGVQFRKAFVPGQGDRPLYYYTERDLQRLQEIRYSKRGKADRRHAEAGC